MIDLIKNLTYCRKNESSNNVELLLSFIPTKDTNSVSFSNINILLNNPLNCVYLLDLEENKLISVLKAFPSQIRTLLALDNFNKNLLEATENDEEKKQKVSFIKSQDYSKFSKDCDCFSTTTALNNPSLTQLTFSL